MRAPAIRVPVSPDAASDAAPYVLVHLPATEMPGRAEALRRRVTRLARRAGARLVLADVLPELPPLVRRFLPDGAATAALLRDARTHALEAHAAHLRRAGIPTATVLLEGSAAVALVQEQLRGGYRLLVAGVPAAEARGEEADAARRLARQLVRKATCPVRLVRTGRDDVPRLRRRGGAPRVVAAVEAPLPGEGDTQVERALLDLGRRILGEAAAQAQAAGASLHVVHAWRALGEGLLRTRQFAQADVARYRADLEREARTAVEALVAGAAPSLAVPVASVTLVEGDPADALPAAVAGGVDALVVGTVARTGLAGLLIGNTADELIARAPCDVVIVKPSGFVSPIAPPGATPEGRAEAVSARA